MRRGDSWQEQLKITSSGSQNTYITFTAYGSGHPPTLGIPASDPDNPNNCEIAGTCFRADRGVIWLYRVDI